MSSADPLFEALNQLCQPVRRERYPRSLATMRALLAAIGDPQRELRAITVTGSSGKSSACHRLALKLQARGLRVGCYLSPHLHSFRERFLLNGRRIGTQDFCEGAALVARAADALPTTVSTFERSTALALWWFRRREAQWVVLETGLGGRFDAVNAAGNLLALFTPIEAEHAAMLGGDQAGVAWHKAGIIQPQGQAISAPQSAPVRAILQEEAARTGATLRFSDADLADAALRHLEAGGLVAPAADPAPPELSGLPGRMERVALRDGPPMLIDGGHTAAAARYLRAAVERPRSASTPGMVWLIAGFLADKDAGAWLRVFDDPGYRITLTRAPGHRAADPQGILAACRLRRAQIEVEGNFARALGRARESDARLVVVSGSLRLAARARVELGLLDAEELAEARLTERVFGGAGYLARLPD